MNHSMAHEEFARVDQRPQDIVPGVPAAPLEAIQVLRQSLAILIARQARQSGQAQFVENLHVVELGVQEPADAVLGGIGA